MGERAILSDVSFAVERGETLILLGRSGSGKTTALRLINRLLEPSSGSILIEGRETSAIEPVQSRRGIGYVIQEFGLMPHWSIEQNVAMVPGLLGWDLPRQQARSKELLEQVGLDYEGLRSRKPGELSGGQRQRVAVARALAASPGLLLFDEPFGALDPVTRSEMQSQFLALRSRYHIASVFVTHDIAEALVLGTRIAVLEQGRLEILTTPDGFFHVDTPLATAFRKTLPAELVEARQAR